MSISRSLTSVIGLTATLGLGLSAPAMAGPRHAAHHAGRGHSGVRFARQPQRGGYQTLVSDGHGTGYGFHRLPEQFSIPARIARDRQERAVHETVVTDALTHGGYYSGGFLGDSVYGAGSGAAYGVFNGADGYGSPYFAGYYGPGDGEDHGIFGRTYAN